MVENFMIAVTTTYLYAILLLSLRAKIAPNAIRPAKIFLIILAALDITLLIMAPGTGIDLVTQIVVVIPVLYMLFMTYINELRGILKKIGLIKSRGRRSAMINNELADKLLDTVDFLSNRKIGALITIERTIDLSAFISKAMMINAPVSSELLASIFIPTTPLHDGAVIIRNNSILCAKAYYPSTERTDLPLHFGTRHRAAIGISEQTDALTIVVSEETGYVSVAINRQLDYNVSKETLNLYFEKYLKIQ
ncbi:MAG: DNA integrity scanning protein DisA nucleotide-binding domain protein [Bacilli bacterium]|nr:DNA integrity scanning protein DisA nucleotide-binding domain protein [Bacilli bacterium]MBN2696643.1 DNA integrity scanning protein DisA nucleotide-binding domain protein [Bacilli bacterium]